VVLLDHHRSAFLKWRPKGGDFDPSRPNRRTVYSQPRFHIDVNLEHSGAWLAWEWFHRLQAAAPRKTPALVRAVEDRDLWRFRLPHTRSFCAVLKLASETHGQAAGFRAWGELLDPIEAHDVGVLSRGAALLARLDADVRKMAIPSTRLMLGEIATVAVCAPGAWASEVANHLLTTFGMCGVALVWTYEGHRGEFLFEFRSRPDGPDVSVLAAALGGGGHARAAGARCSDGRARALVGRLTGLAEPPG